MTRAFHLRSIPGADDAIPVDLKPSLIQAALTPELTEHIELTEATIKGLAIFRKTEPLERDGAIERAFLRLETIPRAVLLEATHRRLIDALEWRFCDHQARGLLDAMVTARGARLAARAAYVDSVMFLLEKERLPPPILAGAVRLVWLKHSRIPDQKTLLEICRAHRAEVRKAAALVKHVIELHANAQAIISAAGLAKPKQGQLFGELPEMRNPCPRPKPPPIPRHIKPRPLIGNRKWKLYAVDEPNPNR